MTERISQKLIQSAEALADAVDQLSFEAPTDRVYNPLRYAWAGHEAYMKQFGDSHKKILFMGMNPGPFGMAQTGVPFGEIEMVRSWIGIDVEIGKPENEHPKRPIDGFACTRSEVSGRRLWGAFRERFGEVDDFFKDHFVVNYCPLVFMEESGKNRTPDKMPSSEVAPLYTACDQHLRDACEILQPEWVIGVGAFAEGRARKALLDTDVQVGRILHPSPASPAANRGWAEQATKQLVELGIW